MKFMKKSLCVFLSMLFVMTGLSAGILAFAADSVTDDTYRSLALTFFNYETTTSGATTTYTIRTDSYGIPETTIVGDLDQYEVSSESGEYVYSDDSGNAIRAIAYDHLVTAKDNSSNQIWRAANIYLSMASTIMSTTYGVGYYTVPMITEAISQELMLAKNNGEYIFLDGYTYIVDAYGDIVGRSVEKTYEVVDGEVSYYSDDSDSVIYMDESGITGTISELYSSTGLLSNTTREVTTVSEQTLYEACNVETILTYFSGNMTTVNSGNWFHTFVFNVYTDIETVLITEELSSSNLTVYNRTVTWTMNRSYDESGTKAQYYNNGYELVSAPTTIDTTRGTLSNLKGTLDGYFVKYYAEGVLDNATNTVLINSYYKDIITYYDVFDSISNEAKIAVFGADAYSYMNLVTQLTPIVGSVSLDEYCPTHTYEKYTDSNGDNVVYEVTTEKVTSIVSTIDSLLTSEKVGDILKTFFDFTDEQYADYSFYGVEANTAQDVLIQVIQYYLYSDSTINAILEFLYPMVCDLLDEYLTDAVMNDLLGSALDSIIGWFASNDDGWQAMIYGVLSSIGVGLTPAGVAYVWNYYGYMSTSDVTFNAVMQANHDILKAAKGGTNSVDNYSTGDYYAIGEEGDEYYGDRWGNVDFDSLVWNINGDEEKFKSYLDAILAPFAPLLGVILGNQESKLKVGAVIEVDLYIYLHDLTLYNDVIIPLLEMLEIPNLCTPARFETLANAINSDSSRNKTTVENFLNEGLLDPILDWVKDVVLVDPISTIAELLPNISYFLTSGAFVTSVKAIDIPIGIVCGITIDSVYTLNVEDDLLGDALDFLDSIQGILDLIGFSVDTGIPIIGYYEDGGNGMVYRPGDSNYNSSTMTEAATTAYVNANGDLNIYQNSEYSTEVSGYNSDGSYSEYVIYNQVGWADSSGNVVTSRTTEQTSTHTKSVTQYYEYKVYDDEAQTYITYRKATLPDDITDYTLVQSIETLKASAELPAIMDYKLQDCGVLTETTSIRTSSFSMTDANGTSATWAAYTRKHIVLEKFGEETEGLVLLFIFRYLFAALEYRAYDADSGEFIGEYSIIDALGLRSTLTEELFSGFKLQDIIDNIALNPDEAIASLYELFYPNETGSMYKVENGTVVSGSSYTYGMDYVNYYYDEIMDACVNTGDYTYGSSVLYTEYWTAEDSSYVMNNLDDIIDNVLTMLKIDGFESIGGLVSDLLDEYVFNNEMVSTIATLLYSALDSIDEVDLSTILKAALDVDYSKSALADALAYEFKDVADYTNTTTNSDSVYAQLKKQANSSDASDAKYSDTTFYKTTTTIDEDTGNDITTLTSYDWGFDNEAVTAKYSNAEIFLRAISAFASPFALLVEYLFCGDNLSIFDLIIIPGYDTYYYAWIPLMEAIGATDLLDYKTYYGLVFNGESETSQNCDAIYYLVKPLMTFVEDLVESPIEFLFDILPNIMFVISIGGLNDILNNLLHFAYVLLDILQPVYDVYPLMDSLLSNLDLGGISLNLSIPLDIDFNDFVNTLIEGLTGTYLTFDIENKNIVLGSEEVEEEVFSYTLDENGEVQYDENGDPIGEYVTQTVTEYTYAVGTLSITLPYIDLTTFCAGTVATYYSKSGNMIIHLDSAGGSDLLTLLLRLVVNTLFLEDNAMNIADFLIGYCQLEDEYDSDELLIEIFSYLNDQALSAELPDKTLQLLYNVYSTLVPIADNLGYRFANVDFSIIDMFSDFSNITTYISALLNAGDSSSSSTLSGFALLIAKIKALFQAIIDFFTELFS